MVSLSSAKERLLARTGILEHGRSSLFRSLLVIASAFFLLQIYVLWKLGSMGGDLNSVETPVYSSSEEHKVVLSWQCTELNHDKLHTFHGEGAPSSNTLGHIYMLGRQLSGREQSQQLLISGEGQSSFDVLMGGPVMRGAFDVVKPSNKTIMIYNSDDNFTTFTGMDAPLWLVVYREENANVRIHHAVGSISTSTRAKSKASLMLRESKVNQSSCPIDLLPSNGVHHAVGSISARTRAESRASLMLRESKANQFSCPIGLLPSDGAEYQQVQDSFRRLTKKLGKPERRPFFKRRNATSDSSRRDLVTICTQLTVDRLVRLESMAINFAGPISAAIFVGRYRSVEEEIEEVTAAWEGSEAMQSHVDIHVVVDENEPWFKVHDTSQVARADNPYPINILRQESIIRAETDWILLIEGDMIPIPNCHEVIRSNWERMLQEENKILKEKNGTSRQSPGVAFIVALYNAPTDDRDDPNLSLSERVPKSKEQLVSALKDRKVERMVNDAHKQFDYSSWEKLQDPSFMLYRWSTDMEPYYIAKKESILPYDPLFMGIGKDKKSQVSDMAIAGITFVVHPFIFTINFGSDGVGESWIDNEKVNKYWRKHFVEVMHPSFVSGLNVRTSNCAT